MPKNRIIIILAACVALLPVLGFPKAWESFFQVAAGLAIILVSVWAAIDRKLKLHAKAQMRSRKAVEQSPKSAEPPVPVVSPETEAFGKRVTDFYPKTGQQGRRASDIIKPSVESEELGQ